MKVILSLLFVLLFSRAFCCSCVTIGTPPLDRTILGFSFIASCKIQSCDTIEYADTVSVTKIDAVTDYYRVIRIHKRRYKIQIVDAFRNTTYKQTNCDYIVSGTAMGDCGYLFEVGKTYIIFARQEKLKAAKDPLKGYFVETDACTKTALYNTALETALRQMPSVRKCNKKWRRRHVNDGRHSN